MGSDALSMGFDSILDIYAGCFNYSYINGRTNEDWWKTTYGLEVAVGLIAIPKWVAAYYFDFQKDLFHNASAKQVIFEFFALAGLYSSWYSTKQEFASLYFAVGVHVFNVMFLTFFEYSGAFQKAWFPEPAEEAVAEPTIAAEECDPELTDCPIFL